MNRAWKHVDAPLWMLGLVLSVIGLFAILDAGYAQSLAANKGMLPREFIVQFGLLLLGVVISFALVFVKPTFWKKAAPWLFGISVALLFCVELFGQEQNQAKRWLNIGILVQPAEFVKITSILYLASVFADRPVWSEVTKPYKDGWGFMKHVLIPKAKRAFPIVLVLLAAYMIEHEKDLGTAAVVLFVSFMLMILGKVSWKSTVLLATVLAITGVYLVNAQSYRKERIVNHAGRWKPEHFDDEGYQTIQSEASIAEGGIIGVGIGRGQAKTRLPAATTDFVMATVGEETGMVGALGVLALLGAMVWWMTMLAARAANNFTRLVIYGCAAWLAVQGCTNMMMANAFLPAIGIPFPFVSSGGSSLLSLWFALGVCQSVLGLQAKKGVAREAGTDRWRNGRTRLSRA